MDTTHVDAALNAALVATDIAQSHEEYLDLVDRFYAEDVEASSEGCEDRIIGKKRLAGVLTSWLLPLHVMAEVGGVSVMLRLVAETPTDIRGTHHSDWVLELTGVTGSRCSVSWCCTRTWRGAKVTSGFHYNHQQIGAPLGIQDLRRSTDAAARATF